MPLLAALLAPATGLRPDVLTPLDPACLLRDLVRGGLRLGGALVIGLLYIGLIRGLIGGGVRRPPGAVGHGA